MESCLGYRFALELVENDFKKNDRWSGDSLFKTAALPKVVNLDPRKITVGYHWDPVKHVSDLRQASIKIPKASIQNANCLDYIQVGFVTVYLYTNNYMHHYIHNYNEHEDLRDDGLWCR